MVPIGQGVGHVHVLLDYDIGQLLQVTKVFSWQIIGYGVVRAASRSIWPLFKRFLCFVHVSSNVDQIMVMWVRQFYYLLWIHP